MAAVAQIVAAGKLVLRDHDGRAYSKGPVVDTVFRLTPSAKRVGPELKSMCVDLDTVCAWIDEVEDACKDTKRAVQMLRRIWYAPATYHSPRFDQAIRTDTTNLLTTDKVSQATLDGLARSGLLALSDPADPGSVVDLSHVLVLLDLALNGWGANSWKLWSVIIGFGYETSVEAMLSWHGDLASIFTGYQTARQRWLTANPGKTPPTGPATTPDSDAGWLETSYERSPLSDLLGDIDGVILAREVTPTTKLADLLHGYYSSTTTTAGTVSVANRFPLFVARADPAIPTTGGALRADAQEDLRVQVNNSATALLRVARYEKGLLKAMTWSTDVDTAWGKSACEAIGDRWLALLKAGLAGTPLTPGWPADLPDPLNVGYPPAIRGRAAELVQASESSTVISMLEGVTQYFTTNDEPWGTPPAKGSRVRRVHLGDLSGVDAHQVKGAPKPTVELRDGYGLAAVWPALSPDSPHRDLLKLDGATGTRASHVFRIESVDVRNRRLVLDAEPGLGDKTSAWTVLRRPQLVVVDPLGARPGLTGAKAVAAPAAAGAAVVLDGPADASLWSGVNLGLDTLLLEGATNVPRLPFRILAVDLKNAHAPVVRLDRMPTLGQQAAGWQVCSGIGGTSSELATSLPFAPPKGADHYDALMVMVKGGVVVKALPWSSYSSFYVITKDGQAPKDPRAASLKGNRHYDVYGYFSDSEYRNYSFAVREVSGRSQEFDSLSENLPGRLYARDVGTLPFANAKALAPGDSAEQRIRLHYGNQVPASKTLRTGSAGCLVSPRYCELRSALIEAFQEELVLLGQPRDANLDMISDAGTLKDSEALFNEGTVGKAQWKGIVVAELYVVHPDERPITATVELKRFSV